MPRAVRTALILTAIPALVLIWTGFVFALDRAADEGEVLARVTVGGVPLAGLTRAEAASTIREVETRLGSVPVIVDIAGTEFVLYPHEVGFDIDDEAVIAAAMQRGRGGGFLTELRWWVANPTGGPRRELGLPATFDRDAVRDLLHSWEAAAIADPPLEGGIAVEGNRVVPVYPRAGTGLDHEATLVQIEAAILGDGGSVSAVTRPLTPGVTAADVDRAVVRARGLVAQAVTLVGADPTRRATIPPEVLRNAISSRVVTDAAGRPAIDLFFSIAPLAQHLAPLADEFEMPPVDAQFVVEPGDIPVVVAGAAARVIDDGRLPDAVLAAAGSVTRTGSIPLRDGAAPDLTTEEAAALGITELLYTATTYFTAGGDTINQNRVHNIHRIAEQVDGAIVLPGEVFSLNEHVGERTAEGGYLPAKAVVYRGPQIGRVVYCCDHPANIGGGVSQFATTLYNAIWWAGLEDVEHTPHSIYFTRYPMVREATLGYPTPDLRFRNNTEHGILIVTEHTANSVTVKVFGDNGGITVEGTTSERRWFEQPYVYYEADSRLAPGVEEVRAEGTPGFTADVTRVITFPDGHQQTQKWTWTYDPNPTVIGVHPCSLPEEYPNRQPVCPVSVPDLTGMAPAAAESALAAVGLGYAEGVPYPVSDPASVGKVMVQDPAAGAWLVPPGTVVVRIGVLA